MKYIFNRLIILAFLFSSGATQAEWFKTDNDIHFADINKPSTQTRAVKNAATLRMGVFVDGRANAIPKKIGVSNQRIGGISSDIITLDCAVTELVAGALKKRFDDTGFQWIEGQGNALYELSGVVKEFIYNVKERDEVTLSVETTLKEIATGTVIWSGVVMEKNSRFAGVSGNTKNDVTQYLRHELAIVSKKTIDAINASLNSLRPDLFTIAPGAQVTDGVVVLQAQTHTAQVSPVPTAVANGTLSLNTQPARAKVYVDGVYFGLSPLRADIPVGIHPLSLQLDGFKTVEEKISIRNGQTTELELTLEKRP
jgi:hypothetical protein